MIAEFYAVTGYLADPAKRGLSLYKITNDGSKVTVKKIRLEGHSLMPQGSYLENGNCLGIMLRGLQRYNRSRLQRVDDVNTINWGGGSTPIIGMFFSEWEAVKCFESNNLQHWDKRFLDQTENVLFEIGPESNDLISLDSKLASALKNKRLREFLGK